MKSFEQECKVFFFASRVFFFLFSNLDLVLT